jgi:hypothetical protein
MAIPSIDDLKRAKSEAKKLVKDIPDVVAIGIGDGCLRIYLKREIPADVLPSELCGVPVEVIVSGQVKPFAASA